MHFAFLAAGAAILAASPAAAQLRPLVEPPASVDAARDGVDVFLVNDGGATLSAEGPATIATRAADGTMLSLSPASAEQVTVRPGAFAKVRYRLSGDVAVAPKTQPAPAAEASAGETVLADSSGGSGGFLDRLRPHEPIYGAFGAGDAGGKLQVSFAFRGLGRADGPNLVFAYTQTMFWAVDKPSGPFRATNYSPELYADMPLDQVTTLGLGYRHDSNGLGTAGSVDMNRIFARVSRRFDMGDGWRLDLTPQAWFYFGEHGIASDMDRYRGFTSLTAAIGQQDGLKLQVMGRGNPGTGKGAAEAFLSYPLAAVWNGLPHIYLFGQAFTGYGEALTDYNRQTSRARLGIAFTR